MLCGPVSGRIIDIGRRCGGNPFTQQPIAMQKFFFLLFFLFVAVLAHGQDKEGAEALVKEGIALHDNDDLAGALAKYDEALALDKDNFWAMAEKAMTLNGMREYQAAVDLCEKTITLHPKEDELPMVYVTYGNSLDVLGKADKALKVYDAGLKKFPRSSMLNFNKGITLTQREQYEAALASFRRSAGLNPMHASSHNAIARLLFMQDDKIPSLLAFCRFAALEPQSRRTKENLGFVEGLLKANVTKTDDQKITINVDPKLLDNKGKKKKENNFNTIELLLSMSAALDYDEKYADESKVETFIRKMGSICSSMKELRNDNSGFYWDHYADYFIAMNDEGLLETLGHLVFATSGLASVEEWLDGHEEEIDKFYAWNAEYNFPPVK